MAAIGVELNPFIQMLLFWPKASLIFPGNKKLSEIFSYANYE